MQARRSGAVYCKGFCACESMTFHEFFYAFATAPTPSRGGAAQASSRHSRRGCVYRRWFSLANRSIALLWITKRFSAQSGMPLPDDAETCKSKRKRRGSSPSKLLCWCKGRAEMIEAIVSVKVGAAPTTCSDVEIQYISSLPRPNGTREDRLERHPAVSSPSPDRKVHNA